jgi:hypothetical protein
MVSASLAYYRRNRDQINKRRLELRNSNPQLHLFRCTKARAKSLGIDFNLDLEDVQVPELCPICKIPLFFSAEGRADNTPSMDRIDPTKGYVKGNVGVISWRANRCKNNMSKEDIERLYDYISAKS